MRFPDFIYVPTAKGANTGLVPKRHLVGFALSTPAGTVTLTNISSLVGVSLESVLIVTFIHAEAIAGAAQTVNTIEITIESADTGLNIVADVDRSGGPLAPLNVAIAKLNHSDLELVLMPREFIRASGTFSAALASNQMRLTVAGYFVNRGNFQHG